MRKVNKIMINIRNRETIGIIVVLAFMMILGVAAYIGDVLREKRYHAMAVLIHTQCSVAREYPVHYQLCVRLMINDRVQMHEQKRNLLRLINNIEKEAKL